MLGVELIFTATILIDFVIAMLVTYMLFVDWEYTDVSLFAGASSLILGLHHLTESVEEIEFIKEMSDFFEVLAALVLLFTIIKVGVSKQVGKKID